MSDVIDLNWIGAQLRAIQAEQRTLKSEGELFRTMLAEVLRLLSERIGNFEALMEARIERVEARIGNFEVLVEGRFEQIDIKLDRITAALAQISGRIG
jgi:hypothetical protein